MIRTQWNHIRTTKKSVMFLDWFQQKQAQSQTATHDTETEKCIMHTKDQIILILQAIQKFILSCQC